MGRTRRMPRPREALGCERAEMRRRAEAAAGESKERLSRGRSAMPGQGNGRSSGEPKKVAI